MKSFRNHISEVAVPKPAEEKAFWDQHNQATGKHPVATDAQHKGHDKPKAKRSADQEGDANYDKAVMNKDTRMKGAAVGVNEAADTASPGESAQIDEISKTKMGQYIKRAHADKDTQTKRAGIFDKKGMDADKDKDMYGAWDKANKARKKADNRTKFISKAVDRLTKEAADVASPDESSMAMDQADFIAYVAREMKEHLKANKEFPEWMQNKLSKLQQAAQDLHGNFGAHGDDEDVNEELKGGQKKLDHNKNGKLDAHDFMLLRKKKNEEVEQLDELSPKTLKSYQKKADRDAGKSFNKANDIEDKEGEKGRDVWSGTNKASQKHGALMDRGEKRSAGAELARKKLIAKGHKSPKMSYEQAELEEEVFAMDIDYNQEKRLATAAKAAGLAIKFVQAGGATEMQLRGDKDKITKFLKARRVPASEISRGWFKEETEELDEVSQKTLWSYHAKAGADLQAKRKKLDKGTLTMKDLKKGQNRVKGLNRAADKMHEEVEVTETTSSALKRPITVTGPDGKTRTVMRKANADRTDDSGHDKITTRESVEVMDEAFRQGIVKFNDKSQMILKKEDADALNNLFKGMSAGNRNKMTKEAMENKKAFEEILSFAKEA